MTTEQLASIDKSMSELFRMHDFRTMYDFYNTVIRDFLFKSITHSDPAQQMQSYCSVCVDKDDIIVELESVGVSQGDKIIKLRTELADKDRDIARLRIMVDTCEKAYDGMAILHRAECAKTKSLESELAELKRREQAAPKIVLPERDVLLSQATEYANSRLPQQYSLIDRSDWVEYKDDIVEYILDTLYGKVTND